MRLGVLIPSEDVDLHLTLLQSWPDSDLEHASILFSQDGCADWTSYSSFGDIFQDNATRVGGDEKLVPRNVKMQFCVFNGANRELMCLFKPC